MNIVYHIPNEIDFSYASGSQIRPIKMLEAFRNIGYNVDVVMGDVKLRRKQIKDIKKKILCGVKYDFIYSESSTMPTALTEKHHLPIAPLLDFNFFSFCKNRVIQIGLFYRDIHWEFDQYNNSVAFCKRIVAKTFYRFDLRKYKRLVDVLFLPSRHMYDFIPFTFNKKIIDLPPACELKQSLKKINQDKLNFIYVGGLGDLYDLELFSKIVNNISGVSFKLCTREKEWEENKGKYIDYLENIDVFHKSGKDLNEIFSICDVAVLVVKPTIYWKFVMAVKLFEYIAYEKPIIAIKNTAVGDFIQKYNIGWVVDYDDKEIAKIIGYLKFNPQEIEKKVENIRKIISYNTWEARAKQVQKILK